MKVLFLDVDGVLNRTGFRPDENHGLRSWIEPELAARLTDVLQRVGAELVMSSDWRIDRSHEHLASELTAAGVHRVLHDVTPHLPGQPRWREIEAWLAAAAVAADDVVIVDDGFDMGELNGRFVRTSPLNGLDADAAARILELFSAS